MPSCSVSRADVHPRAVQSLVAIMAGVAAVNGSCVRAYPATPPRSISRQNHHQRNRFLLPFNRFINSPTSAPPRSWRSRSCCSRLRLRPRRRLALDTTQSASSSASRLVRSADGSFFKVPALTTAHQRDQSRRPRRTAPSRSRSSPGFAGGGDEKVPAAAARRVAAGRPRRTRSRKKGRARFRLASQTST